MAKSYWNINLEKKVHEKLKVIKKENGFESFSEAIGFLLLVFDKINLEKKNKYLNSIKPTHSSRR